MRELVAQPCTTELFYLGECCRWDAIRAELSWVDVPTGRLFRASANGPQIDVVRIYEFEGPLTAFAPLEDRRDGWIVASDQQLLFLDESGSTCEATRRGIYNAFDIHSNDGVSDPWGRFWIGSMASDEGEGRGSLHRFHASTGFELILKNVTISNGIAWSPDCKTMYYVDSGPGTIYAFEVDATGEIGDKRVFAQINVEVEGTPDGMCVDSLGALWVAMWGGYEVRQYSASGVQLARVSVATAQPSCCTIGGSNGTTLYITTAQEDMPAETLQAERDAGRLFCVDVGVVGMPINQYRRTVLTEV